MRGGGIARLARRLGEIEPGLDPLRVEELLDALTLTSLYERLVTSHGWSADDYESCLAGTLRREVRGAAAASRSGPRR